jgi:hypothetical protein
MTSPLQPDDRRWKVACGGSGDCVEVAVQPDGADVRSTMNPAAELHFTPAAWTRFIAWAPSASQ